MIKLNAFIFLMKKIFFSNKINEMFFMINEFFYKAFLFKFLKIYRF